MDQRKKLGNKGETLAAAFLKKRGFEILERQFRSKFGEIDLVALDRQTLVFVEVKTRSSSDYGTGLEAITPRKIERIIKAGQFFRLRFPATPAAIRLDAVVIEVDESGQAVKLKHVRNISGY